MRTLLRASALVSFFVLGLACSDDKKSSASSDAGTATEAQRTCKSLCKRADECGLLDTLNYTVAECETPCVDNSESEMTSGECPAFTAAEITACSKAAEAQDCAEVTAGTLPKACMKSCTVTDKSVLFPGSVQALLGN